jgi:hypothetical protein
MQWIINVHCIYADVVLTEVNRIVHVISEVVMAMAKKITSSVIKCSVA